MKKCIYCNQTKDESEFLTLEHILPSSLGGKIVDSDILRTRMVCNKCNSLCGLFVDAAFVKNKIIAMDEYLARLKASKFIDSVLPFPIYIGLSPDGIIDGGMLCERWMFPGGTAFLYYPQEERYLSYIGGNPRNKKKNCYAFIFLTIKALSDISLKMQTILAFEAFFHKKAKLIAGNFNATEVGLDVMFQ